MTAGGRLPRAARGGLAAAILAFAAVFDWLAGRRGFFAFDQSIPFDAGWRVLSGQVPFRDFVLPVGPVVPWVQAAGLGLFGADYGGYLATGAAVNALAAGAAMALTARLFPGRWSLWGGSGLLTAVWFLPPSGTPWFEQVATLAGLAALALLAGPAVAEETPGRRGLLAGAGAGALAVVAFLAKQNVGVFLLPAYATLLAAPLPDARRAARQLAAWLAGLGIAAGACALWVALRADPGLLALHLFRLPAAVGLERILEYPRALMAVHAVGLDPPALRWTLLAAVAVAGAALVAELRRDRCGDRRLRAAALLTLALFAFQHLLWVSAGNQPEMVAVVPGIVLVLAGGVALARVERRPPDRAGLWRAARTAVVLAVGGAGLLLALRGVEAAWSREGHEGVAEARAYGEVEVPGLEPMRWAEGTLVTGPPSDPAEGPGLVRRSELRTLVRTLRERPGNLFVFPDWTVLYGLLGKPSPQPLLWFHPGLTYPAEPGPVRDSLDRAIVDALAAHRVTTVVIERASWMGTGDRLADFPALAAYLERCFAPERRIGLFEVRGLDPGAGPGCHRSRGERPTRSPG